MPHISVPSPPSGARRNRHGHDARPVTLPRDTPQNFTNRRLERVRRGARQDHSDGPGIMEANEQLTFTPFPRYRHPASGHPLRDLPADRGLQARHPQRGADRALPARPSRSAPPFRPLRPAGRRSTRRHDPRWQLPVPASSADKECGCLSMRAARVAAGISCVLCPLPAVPHRMGSSGTSPDLSGARRYRPDGH